MNGAKAVSKLSISQSVKSMSCTRQAGSSNCITNDDDNNNINNTIENELVYNQLIRKDLEEWRLSSVYSCNKRDRSPTIYDIDDIDEVETVLTTISKDTASSDDMPSITISNNSASNLSSTHSNPITATKGNVDDDKSYSSEIQNIIMHPPKRSFIERYEKKIKRSQKNSTFFSTIKFMDNDHRISKAKVIPSGIIVETPEKKKNILQKGMV